MIITKTPYRISFFGGGTDYPAWYESNGGAVLSATIDKYNYINCRPLPPFFKYRYRVVYSNHEEVNKISDIKHHRVREALNHLNFDSSLAVFHSGDLPARSGLGSSSSFTVGFLNALHSLKGELRTKHDLAMDAIHVEQRLIKENVGSQDQTATAFGGLNKISFGGPQTISVSPIILPTNKLTNFQNHLMLFFTDFARDASKIAKTQIKNIPNKKRELELMHGMVDEGIGILKDSKRDINDFGKLLHEAWKIKRSLSLEITNSKINSIYNTGIRAGATGGKLLGAGGGGFMLFFVKPEFQDKVRKQLKHLLYVPFEFEHLGSQVIYFDHQDLNSYHKKW